MNSNTRLRIATRIHFALRRHLGEGVDVGTMLKSSSEAREVLWVCDALGDTELAQLAEQFRHCDELEREAAKAAAGHMPQDTGWAKDTSGFGFSQIGESHATFAPAAKPEPERGNRLTQWLRRATR